MITLAKSGRKIAYLLHRFPGKTDTFIKREIRGLQALGRDVRVISVWRPAANETTLEQLTEWASDTSFALPRSLPSIVWNGLRLACRSPLRFLSAARLAFSTAQPGIRGAIYQAIYFVQAVLVARILQEQSIQHVHNHIGDQSGTVTMLAAHLAGIPYSITYHGWPVFFDAKNARIREKVLNAEFSRAISYFCQSQLMMFSDCDDLSKFKIVHCGLEIDKYAFRLPRREVKTLFCAARLSTEKGLAFMIRATKLVRERGLDVQLRLAGDGPAKESLVRLVQELNMLPYVHFLGYIPEQQVTEELKKSDLFVLSSFVEGLPVSAMEAMAIGVPVIATNIAGTGELVEDGKTGRLVRASDAVALADAIVASAKNHDFRISSATLGRAKVEEEFDIKKECERLNAAFG